VEQRTGVDIAFIFEKEGEEGFRRREKLVIAELTAGHGLVLATGGGAVLDADNRLHLAGRGFVVYLRASIDHQLRRTGRTDSRPLLQTGDPRETLERLFAVRDPLYREVADLVVDADGANARTLALDISRHIDAAAS
jgi:shikimate kinase